MTELYDDSFSIDVDQFLESVKSILGSLLERYTGAQITEKLGSSIIATVFRQLVMLSCVVHFNWLHRHVYSVL